MAKNIVIGFGALLVTIPTPAAPVAISPEKKWTTEAEIYNPTGNSSIYYGGSDVDSATHIPRAAGSITGITSLDMDGEPRHFDLNKIYITGTAGDVVRVQFRKPLYTE